MHSLRRLALVLITGIMGCGTPTKPAPTESTASPQPDSARPSGDTALPPGDCQPVPERCNGKDDDCDGQIDEADEDLVDGLPFFTDADGDGYGSDHTTTACTLEAGIALSSGDCDDSDPTVHPEAEEACDGTDRNCDGEAGIEPGTTAACAVESCRTLWETDPSLPNGAYWLALPSGTATPVWCDLTGGGWTLGFLRNSAASGNQADFGAEEQGLGSLSLPPDSASATDAAALGSLDLNAMDWTELVLTGHALGVETVRSEAIPRTHLRLSFGEPGYLLYGAPSPYIWCGGDSTYTDAGVGQVAPPDGAPSDCRGHTSLGSGWDFSDRAEANGGLTLCGSDGYGAMTSRWGEDWVFYGSPGAAQAIWVR